MDCEKLRAFLNEKDRFCRECGIMLTAVAPGYAEAELEINESVYNGRSVVQGGAIMTLADFAFAGAANAMGGVWVSQNVSTNFIRPGQGKKLRGIAEKVHHGKATAVYSVKVIDDNGKLVASTTITGYNIDPGNSVVS